MIHISNRFQDSHQFGIHNGLACYYSTGNTFLEKFKNKLPIHEVMRVEMDVAAQMVETAVKDNINIHNIHTIVPSKNKSIHYDEENFPTNMYYKEPLKDKKYHKKKFLKNSEKRKPRNMKKNKIRQNGYDDKLFHRETLLEEIDPTPEYEYQWWHDYDPAEDKHDERRKRRNRKRILYYMILEQMYGQRR
jgi:hypothetical protein